MTYYPTIEEDLARAKKILETGKPDHDNSLLPPEYQELAGGVIYGQDTYAAYKLLESFVAEIERMRAREGAIDRRASYAVEQIDNLRRRIETLEEDRQVVEELIAVMTPDEKVDLAVRAANVRTNGLYEAARKACHDSGVPWTDPRTGITHPAP
jgi:hypothetical protein